jgi:hypothetical protein
MNSKMQLIKSLTGDRWELGLIAMGWLDRHWAELPCDDFPVDWLIELTDVMEARCEDGGQEWLATK